MEQRVRDRRSHSITARWNGGWSPRRDCRDLPVPMEMLMFVLIVGREPDAPPSAPRPPTQSPSPAMTGPPGERPGCRSSPPPARMQPRPCTSHCDEGRNRGVREFQYARISIPATCRGLLGDPPRRDTCLLSSSPRRSFPPPRVAPLVISSWTDRIGLAALNPPPHRWARRPWRAG